MICIEVVYYYVNRLDQISPETNCLLYNTCRLYPHACKWLSRHFKISLISFVYFTNYKTNTRHICTHLNTFLTVNPNMVMKFNNSDIFYNFCELFEYFCEIMTCRLSLNAACKVLYILALSRSFLSNIISLLTLFDAFTQDDGFIITRQFEWPVRDLDIIDLGNVNDFWEILTCLLQMKAACYTALSRSFSFKLFFFSQEDVLVTRHCNRIGCNRIGIVKHWKVLCNIILLVRLFLWHYLGQIILPIVQYYVMKYSRMTFFILSWMAFLVCPLCTDGTTVG